jgi:putative inorganic carbon (hco3(-)) transporter
MRAYIFVLMFVGYLGTVFVTPFCGVLLWMWLALMSPHTQTYDLLPFSYALVVAVVTIIAFVLSRERSFPPNTAVTWALIGMLVFSTLALLNAYDFWRAYGRWDTIWKGIFVSLLSLPLLNSRLRIHAYVWVFALSVGYYGLKGGLFTFLTGGLYRVSAQGGNMLSDNNHLATALVMTVPLIVYLAIHSRMQLMRIACWGFAFMTFVGSIFTYSRGGILAMIGAMAVLWYRSSFKLASTMAVLFGCIVVVLFAPEGLWERFGSIDDFREDGSAMGRLDIWRVSLQLAADHPLFGIGFHATTLPSIVARVDGNVTPRAVHNSYIEVLVEAGVFAFLCHITLFLASYFYLQRVRRLSRGRPDWKWAFDLASMLQVSVAGYAVGSFFLSLGFFDGWWFIVILATALHLRVRAELAGPAGQPARPQMEFGHRKPVGVLGSR